jgi:hypothetical protein
MILQSLAKLPGIAMKNLKLIVGFWGLIGLKMNQLKIIGFKLSSHGTKLNQTNSIRLL